MGTAYNEKLVLLMGSVYNTLEQYYLWVVYIIHWNSITYG